MVLFASLGVCMSFLIRLWSWAEPGPGPGPGTGTVVCGKGGEISVKDNC